MREWRSDEVCSYAARGGHPHADASFPYSSSCRERFGRFRLGRSGGDKKRTVGITAALALSLVLSHPVALVVFERGILFELPAAAQSQPSHHHHRQQHQQEHQQQQTGETAVGGRENNKTQKKSMP